MAARSWVVTAVVALAVTVTAGCGGLFGDQAADPEAPVTGLPVAGEPGSTRTLVAAATGASVVARTDPLPDAPVVAELNNPVATGGPLVFQVTGEEGPWLRVLLPVRPNGTTGWINEADVSLSSNPYRIDIDTTDRRLTVQRDGETIIDTIVAIGTGDTPTPIGSFYLTELLQPLSPDGPYGTFAFGLSGFSETLTEFNGGNGVVGIHGTNDPASLGTDVSHGCVRVENSIIDQMASVLPLGTPVTITT